MWHKPNTKRINNIRVCFGFLSLILGGASGGEWAGQKAWPSVIVLKNTPKLAEKTVSSLVNGARKVSELYLVPRQRRRHALIAITYCHHFRARRHCHQLSAHIVSAWGDRGSGIQ